MDFGNLVLKRVSHKQISNEREKNIAFAKGVESLIKKANDLSILCGVDIGIVFLRISKRERAKKIMTHDKFLKKRLNDEKEDMQKYHNKNHMNESCLLMNELFTNGKNLTELDLNQLNMLQSLADEMLKMIQKREEIDNYYEM
ncbi:hypothetical protein CDL12_18004 [Handroanthus impetiginosus]|uniref:MADS-box domain-containing protein n=1 Tax=Handroanthus impetiginosus TaxID=429701 RepID=A0A2G9GVW5_9LAMI|nr:hypothetical protein CDL12_18004 [Handroanthus impetiginosus]